MKKKKTDATPEASAEPQPVSDIHWRGAGQLTSLLVPISSLRLDEENARLHPERNLAALEHSLREFGQNKPVVVRDGVVFAGNGLVTVAMRLGWTKVAAVDISHLSKTQARAYGLADNKTGDLSAWDFARVGDIMRELPEELLDATGFDAFERESIHEKSEQREMQTAIESAKLVSFLATDDQARIIRGAIEQLKVAQGDLSDGRALELICADFLSGA